MQVPTAEQYCRQTMRLAETAVGTQLDPVRTAAALVADAIETGHRFWAFGTGHSHLLVEEIWGRAGGMTAVHPILEPSLMLHEGLQKSSVLERSPGLAAALLEVHPVATGDCLLVISNSGRNAVPVEVAELAHDRGAKIIALGSRRHSDSVSSRAPSGRKLLEVADVVIDNCGVPGDAIIDSPDGRTGATSTVIGALLVQALATETVGLLQSRGATVELLISNNA
ncbi:MAG TPA: SIS domain-containing protein [Microlunatus sp.]